MTIRLAFLFLFFSLCIPNGQSQAQINRQSRTPQIPPPTILEYKPQSTLVVPEHEVPQAKFPAVDFHGHPPALNNPSTIHSVVTAMDELNLQVMVQARGSSGDALIRQIRAVSAAGMQNRFVFFTTVDLRSIGPGSGARIASQLEEDVTAGAVGIGEINKGFGLLTRKADGSRLQMDDPELDVVWQTAGRLGIPVFCIRVTQQSSSNPLTLRMSVGLRWHSFPTGALMIVHVFQNLLSSWKNVTACLKGIQIQRGCWPT
jgi:hypothetical protein